MRAVDAASHGAVLAGAAVILGALDTGVKQHSTVTRLHARIGHQFGACRRLVGEHEGVDALAGERAARQQSACKPRADKTGAAGDEQFHDVASIGAGLPAARYWSCRLGSGHLMV